MPLKNKSKGIVPWDYQIDDENYQKEPWILKKGKEYVTIEKDKNNNSKNFRRIVFDELCANFLVLSENRKKIRKILTDLSFKENFNSIFPPLDK